MAFAMMTRRLCVERNSRSANHQGCKSKQMGPGRNAYLLQLLFRPDSSTAKYKSLQPNPEQ